MYKQKPKSCSCPHCIRGKHSKAGHVMMTADERAFRHGSKIAIQKGNYANVAVAPIGHYYD